ncbi:MAG: transcription antitermination factor NusB [Minwuiales bacterium]|nr:transcription antitermination factor NusB [Minwuiales bacterium]
MTRRNAGRAAEGGRRSVARLSAVQALYQIEQSQAAVETVIDEILTLRLGQDADGEQFAEPDQEMFCDLVRGVTARREEIDKLVGQSLDRDRQVERLEVILRAVLRAAAYELLARPDIPARVIMNEYVDVAHAFFSGSEPNLVNGVVDQLGRTLRPNEFQA